jgi:sugar-specific transcriptional regulator TrmB
LSEKNDSISNFMPEKIKKTLKDLGFKENETNVYLALTKLGESSAGVVAKSIGLPRTTVIGILAKLEAGGYLTTHKYKGKIYYWIESPRVLGEVFANKVSLAAGLESELADLYRQAPRFPFAKIYDTKQGIAKFTENVLLKTKKKAVIRTFDSPGAGNYRKVFSDRLEPIFFGIKKQRQIFTKTLVPSGLAADINMSKVQNQNIEIKELPDGINFASSFWIIEDAVYFFSGHPPFLAAISHQPIKNGLASMYDYFWGVSKRI